MKESVQTKESLKKLFEGRNEAEIDVAVSDLKSVLDQAAEEVKGELDIADVAPVLKESTLEKIATSEKFVEEEKMDEIVKNVKTVAPLRTAIKTKKAGKRSLVGHIPDLDVTAYDFGGTGVKVGVGDGWNRDFKNEVEETSTEINSFDPIFNEGKFNEKYNPIVDDVLREYEYTKNTKSIDRKKKWNSFFQTIRLPQIKFSYEKEQRVINAALSDLFIRYNKLDTPSLEKLEANLAASRKKMKSDPDVMEMPLLYAHKK